MWREMVFSEYIWKIEKGVRQGSVFLPDLFHLQSKTIVKEHQDLSGFIISGHNIRYIDDSVLIADWERKLKSLLTEEDNKGKPGRRINH